MKTKHGIIVLRLMLSLLSVVDIIIIVVFDCIIVVVNTIIIVAASRANFIAR